MHNPRVRISDGLYTVLSTPTDFGLVGGAFANDVSVSRQLLSKCLRRFLFRYDVWIRGFSAEPRGRQASPLTPLTKWVLGKVPTQVFRRNCFLFESLRAVWAIPDWIWRRRDDNLSPLIVRRWSYLWFYALWFDDF